MIFFQGLLIQDRLSTPFPSATIHKKKNKEKNGLGMQKIGCYINIIKGDHVCKLISLPLNYQLGNFFLILM